MTTGSSGVAAYGRVLRYGPAVRPFAAAVLARLPISMAPLAMVLLVQDVSGSYGIAGIVTAAFAVGTAVGSPAWGRAMDRLGQSRVIVPTVLVSAGLMAALALGAVAGAPDPVLVGLAAGAGLTFPPFSAAMRAAWRFLFTDPASRRAGYALDAVAVETLFVAGPLLLSLLLVTTPPGVPLVVTACLLAGGGLLYASTPPARSRVHAPPVDVHVDTGDDGTDRLRGGNDPATAALTTPVAPALQRPVTVAATAVGLPAVLATTAAMSVAFGAIDTSMAATAREVLHDESRLGLLFAAIAGGSAIGGLSYGALQGSAHEHRRLPVTLGVFGLGVAPVPLLLAGDTTPSLWLLLPLLFIAGLAIAPSLIIQQNLVDQFSPVGRVNEAQAWLSTSVTTGMAGGIAAAGAVIDGLGVAVSFGAAVLAIAGAVLVALGSQRSWQALVPAVAAPAPRPSGVS